MRVTEERSETERHWDNIAMGLIAVSTAAAAAVFLIVGNGGSEANPASDLDILIATFGMTATCCIYAPCFWL